jgi:hypothetical protein
VPGLGVGVCVQCWDRRAGSSTAGQAVTGRKPKSNENEGKKPWRRTGLK